MGNWFTSQLVGEILWRDIEIGKCPDNILLEINASHIMIYWFLLCLYSSRWWDSLLYFFVCWYQVKRLCLKIDLFRSFLLLAKWPFLVSEFIKQFVSKQIFFCCILCLFTGLDPVLIKNPYLLLLTFGHDFVFFFLGNGNFFWIGQILNLLGGLLGF
jgi:hypothetical protein